MPKFLEEKLKKEYGAKSKIPFMVMNKIGAMRGSKITAKGRAMEKKHARDTGHKSTARIKGMGGEVRRPATRSKHQGKSFAENLRRPTNQIGR